MRVIYEKHGLADRHRLYATWKSMRTRCNNPRTSSYKYYGGKGIKVCERWDSFSAFLEDMSPSYVEGLTLDRIDNLGNYCKDNCKWSTHSEQTSNQNKSLKLLFEGEIMTEAELSRRTGVPRTTIQTRRKAGATPEQMVYGFK